MTSSHAPSRTVAEVVASVALALASRLDNGRTPDGTIEIPLDGARGRPDDVPPRVVMEARELVAAVMQQPRYWPSAAAATPLTPADIEAIERAAARRAMGAPLAYAVRSAPFRGLMLYVDERVLIPRPETEYLIDRVLALPGRRPGGIAVDVGTGSGAIALALASEGDFARVIGTDISHDALAVARENGARCAGALRVGVEFRAGGALAPLADLEHAVELLVSNPPYIAFDEVPALPADVRDWEPPLALACAGDGLAVTQAIVADGGRLLRPGGILAFETDSRRAQRVAVMVRENGTYDAVEVLLDLAGRERYVVARRRGTN
ncbi:MAG: peptide chain release factor N(5)-glutamine methyltransferase [Gemmatimonadota bacterium]